MARMLVPAKFVKWPAGFRMLNQHLESFVEAQKVVLRLTQSEFADAASEDVIERCVGRP